MQQAAYRLPRSVGAWSTIALRTLYESESPICWALGISWKAKLSQQSFASACLVCISTEMFASLMQSSTVWLSFPFDDVRILALESSQDMMDMVTVKIFWRDDLLKRFYQSSLSVRNSSKGVRCRGQGAVSDSQLCRSTVERGYGKNAIIMIINVNFEAWSRGASESLNEGSGCRHQELVDTFLISDPLFKRSLRFTVDIVYVSLSGLLRETPPPDNGIVPHFPCPLVYILLSLYPSCTMNQPWTLPLNLLTWISSLCLRFVASIPTEDQPLWYLTSRSSRGHNVPCIILISSCLESFFMDFDMNTYPRQWISVPASHHFWPNESIPVCCDVKICGLKFYTHLDDRQAEWVLEQTYDPSEANRALEGLLGSCVYLISWQSLARRFMSSSLGHSFSGERVSIMATSSFRVVALQWD